MKKKTKATRTSVSAKGMNAKYLKQDVKLVIEKDINESKKNQEERQMKTTT
jgi:hypothetical protein